MLGLGSFFFFSQVQKQNLSWPLHAETSGQQKKFKQFRLEVLSKMGNFCLPSGNFFNKSKPIKSLGKHSPENAASAVLPPYLHALPFLPHSCLGNNGCYPQSSGKALQEHNTTPSAPSVSIKRGIDSLQIQQWVFHALFQHTLSVSAH